MTYTRDEVLLDINGVTKRYGAKEVLSGVTAQVRDLHCVGESRVVGQVVAFLGPSGVGKSQLLQIIAGLEPATAGQVLLNGDKTPVRRGMVGMVFQRYPVWAHRTVISNLVVAARMSGMSATDAKSSADEYLRSFELIDDASKYPGELSGGMQQRLAISRAIIGLDGPRAHPTRLLLMDEPFSALDPNNTHKTCRLIRRIADMQDQNTIIVVTHDLRAALGVADLIWVMGRDRDAAGNVISGGRIVRELDVAQMGLAWRDDIFEMPAFQELEKEISSLYKTL